MQSIPLSFQQYLHNADAVEPLVLVAVWHKPNALEQRLMSHTAWLAKDDVASAQDSGIEVVADVVQIAKGTGIALPNNLFPILNVWSNNIWELTVTEVGSMVMG